MGSILPHLYTDTGHIRGLLPSPDMIRTTRWIVLALALVAVDAAPAQVLLLDASEQFGLAGGPLGSAAELLRSEHGIQAIGPGYGAVYGEWAAAPPPRHGAIEDLLDQARRQYRDFRTEEARETLRHAALEIAELGDEERGGLLVETHWLYVQLAIAGGGEDRGRYHVREIIRLQPWWVPPSGYLTPELAVILEEARSDVESQRTRIQLADLGEGTRIWIDGIELGDERSGVQVVPGSHMIRTEQPGFTASLRQVDLRSGQTWTAEPPWAPAWDGASRAAVREATHGEPPPETARFLTQVTREAGCVWLVVAERAVADEPGSVRAALFDSVSSTWSWYGGRYDPPELAAEVATVVHPERALDHRPPVRPLLSLGIGGAARIVAPGDELVPAAGAMAAEIGGGIEILRHVRIRGIVGVDLHGPATLVLEDGTRAVGGGQWGYLVRLGAAGGPRLPLGRGAWLWIAGGGGHALAGASTRVTDAAAVSVAGQGGWFTVAVGLEVVSRRGLAVGPAVGYVHAVIPLEGDLGPAGWNQRFYSGASRFLELSLRAAIGP